MPPRSVAPQHSGLSPEEHAALRKIVRGHEQAIARINRAFPAHIWPYFPEWDQTTLRLLLRRLREAQLAALEMLIRYPDSDDKE